MEVASDTNLVGHTKAVTEKFGWEVFLKMNQRFGLEVNNSDCKQIEAAGDSSIAKVVVVVIDTSFK